MQDTINSIDMKQTEYKKLRGTEVVIPLGKDRRH